MTHQLSMFTDGEDLPLISGTAPRGSIEPFNPQTEHRQESLAKCRVCLDTGSVDGKRCTCPAGQVSLPPCPLCGKLTTWYQAGSHTLVICDPCGANWDTPNDVYQPTKPKPKRKGPPPFMVHLTWLNGGPKMRQAEPTEELAASTMRHWFNQFAGIKSIVIEDVKQKKRHVFNPAGYLFTVPVL